MWVCVCVCVCVCVLGTGLSRRICFLHGIKGLGIRVLSLGFWGLGFRH